MERERASMKELAAGMQGAEARRMELETANKRLQQQVDMSLQEMMMLADKTTQLQASCEELEKERDQATERVEHMEFQVQLCLLSSMRWHQSDEQSCCRGRNSVH